MLILKIRLCCLLDQLDATFVRSIKVFQPRRLNSSLLISSPQKRLNERKKHRSNFHLLPPIELPVQDRGETASVIRCLCASAHSGSSQQPLRFLPQVDSRSRQLISSHHMPPRHGSVATAEFSNQGFILSRSSLLSNLLSRRYADLFFLIFFHAGMAC
jgi:hypothetical protein